jgi:predicted phosphodiesterase
VKIETNGNVLSAYFDVVSGWEQWYLLVSDIHHDSVYCNQEMWKRHLEEAKQKRALIICTGDLYDAMQGRMDPRRSMKELRPEYRRDDYYDFAVKDIGDFLAPYADNLLMIGRGNHETSILKNANTDLVDRLAFYLNTVYKANVRTGGYGGWIRFMFTHSDGVPDSSLKLKYFHGAGSEAPVTRGVIQTNRQAVYLPDADIVVNGHNHNNYYVPISRERLSNKGVQYFDIQHHVRIPGYKQEYADGSGGWAVERGGVPKPIGAAWMRQYYDMRRIKCQFIMDVQGGELVEPAGYGNDEDYKPYPQDHG